MSGTDTDLVAPSKYELFLLRQVLETNRRSIALHESLLANEKEIEEWAKKIDVSPRDMVSLTEKMMSESQRDYDQINRRLSLELTLLHHLVTIRFLDESSPTQIMAHKSNCSFPINSPILHFPVEPRNRGAIGLRIGERQILHLGSGSREFEVVGINFAELWQIHAHSREPLPRDTSDRPNYSPYHHGGE